MYVKSCKLCQKVKNSQKPFKAPLTSIKPGETLQKWTIDYAGPITLSSRKNLYIFLAVESSSKYTMAYAVPDQRAETLAECLLNLFSLFGVPREISSDRGLTFLSFVIGKLYEILGIKRIKSSAYHPKTQSIVERCNKTLWNLLRSLVKEHREWDQILDLAMVSMRSQVCSSTGFFPFPCLFGRPMRLR